MVRPARLELTTACLENRGSVQLSDKRTKMERIWRARRDSNPRPLTSEASALSTELRARERGDLPRFGEMWRVSLLARSASTGCAAFHAARLSN